MNDILNIIHKTIYQFFDACEDGEEVPMSDKDKLLLEVNKAICNNLKALEQEPNLQPTCNQLATDCISRQAVNKLVDELARAISDEKCHIQRGRNYGRIMHDILELPPVEPERKTGKWIQISPAKIYECSECGQTVMTNDIYCYNFCHNCGNPKDVSEWEETSEVVCAEMEEEE